MVSTGVLTVEPGRAVDLVSVGVSFVTLLGVTVERVVVVVVEVEGLVDCAAFTVELPRVEVAGFSARGVAEVERLVVC